MPLYPPANPTPVDASYVTLATNTTLLNERVLTAGSGLSLTDGGAGDQVTLALHVDGLTAVNGALSDRVPVYNVAAAAHRKVQLTHLLGLLPGTLWGLTLANNSADPTNDIDIAAGQAAADTGGFLLNLSSGLTKRLDALWTVGTNQGGRDTGSIANGWWHVWLIARSDTGVVDALFSLSDTSPTMPTGYDYKRRLGSVLRTGGAIKSFRQYGDEFRWKTPVLDVDVSDQSTTAILRSLTVPPLTGDLPVQAILNVQVNHASTRRFLYVRCPDVDDQAPSLTVAPLSSLISVGGSHVSLGEFTIRTNESGQVTTRADGVSTIVRIVTLGWVDRRMQK